MRSVVMDESRPNFGENAPVLEPLAQPRPKHAFHHGLGSALARQQIHRAVKRELACKLVSEIEAQTRDILAARGRTARFQNRPADIRVLRADLPPPWDFLEVPCRL